MDKKIALLIENLKKRNIPCFFCTDKEEAREKVLEMIPLSASIGISGSKTLQELALVEHLEQRGSKVYNQNKPGISREVNLELRRLGAQADWFVASPNAIALTGELVFISAYGNRIAGLVSAPTVIVVSGSNKIAENLEDALRRAREHAAPLNCKRLTWEAACLKEGACRAEACFSPQFKRMCCQFLIIESEIVPNRLKVVLVGEALGF